jgi:hypothetical protein
LLAAAVAAGSVAAATARADERRFTYVYEATTLPKGDVELEQWLTWKTHKEEDHGFDRLEFRHEIELGLTDRLQASLYVADWHYADGSSVEDDGVDYDDTAVELKYNFTDPVLDPIGLAAYGELKLGDELLELEGKFIAQKNAGPWAFAYNLSLEAEWEEHGYREREGEISQSFGASYEVSPRFLIGAEALHEVPLPDWHTGGDQTFYLGPNASYRAERWWLTGTALVQATDVEDEPDFQMRFLFGVSF